MQLRELTVVLNYIDELFNRHQPEEKYNRLINALSTARTSPSPAVTKQIGEVRAEIQTLQEAAEPVGWNVVRKKLFERFGADRLLGRKALERLNSIFAEHQADPAGAAQAIQEVVNEMSRLKGRVVQTRTGLGPLSEEPEGKETREGEAVLQLVFEGDVSLKTIEDVENGSKKWGDIIAAFSRLARQPPEPARVLTIEKGSIIFELIAGVLVVSAVAAGADKILALLERVLEIKKKALEVRNLGLQNKQLATAIEKEAETALDDSADKIAGELMKEHGWKKDSKEKTDNYGEVRNAVSLSLKQIFLFVEKGGKVDVWDENAPTDPTLQKDLGAAFERIRQIETRVAELKALPPVSENPVEPDGQAAPRS